MRSTKLIYSLALGLLFILTACSGAGSAAPTQVREPVALTLQTNPDPAAVGQVQLTFTALDDKGQPIAGADFDVIADHTEMGGMTLHGKATDQGNGNYAITTDFSMAGKWKVSSQVKTDAVDYQKDFELQVQ